MIRSDRTYRFDAPAAEVWAALTRTDDYRAWWPWLRRFTGDGFAEGAVWQCTVQPPLPYSVRLTITLETIVDGVGVTAAVGGEITGTAELTVAEDGEGSTIRLVSDLAPASPLLQTFALAARPLVVWGHDWVLDRGAAQFRQRAL